MKWGINQSTFSRYYTHRGEVYQGPQTDPSENLIRMELFRGWLKRKIV